MKPLLKASALVLVTALAIRTAEPHAIPLSSEQLVAGSRAVIVATVVEKSARYAGHTRSIETVYTLQLEDTLQGTLRARVQITAAGGELDGVVQRSCLWTDLDVGRRYLLFLENPQIKTFSPFTGASQGVVLEEPQADGLPSHARGASRSLILGPTGNPLGFEELVSEVRRLVDSVAQNPVALPWLDSKQTAAEQSHALPSKARTIGATWKPTGALPPSTESVLAGPPTPQAPQISELGEESATGIELNRFRNKYANFANAPAFIVWNQLPSWMSPWSPRDQWMMARWNHYAAVHYASAAPTGTFAWGDQVFDITGFNDSATMLSVYGAGWGETTLAICTTWWYLSDNIIREADISFNSAVSWTTDNEYGTRAMSTNSTWAYDQSMLHELGHSWGLEHPFAQQDVWWDSVMNYAPKWARHPILWSDDTNALRSRYASIPVHDGALAFYETENDGWSTDALYLNAEPFGTRATVGGNLRLFNQFTLENVGTDYLVNPQIEFYLTPQRMNWSGAEYLSTTSFNFSMPPWYRYYLDPGLIPIRSDLRPGKYFLGMYNRDAADSLAFNQSAWTTYEGRLDVRPPLETLYPAASWQYTFGTSAQEGTYEYMLQLSNGDRVEFSTCPSDGGSGYFDTVLTMRDTYGSELAKADDQCGIQSRLSYRADWTGEHRLELTGYSPSSYGSFEMGYRKRDWDNSLTLWLYKIDSLDSVELLWWDGVGPYDLQRATRPDFSDAVDLRNGTQETGVYDPVLSDGQIYFYRAR